MRLTSRSIDARLLAVRPALPAAGRALAGLQPRIDAIVAAWNEAPTPQADAQVTAALAEVIDRFHSSVPPPVKQPAIHTSVHAGVEPTE